MSSVHLIRVATEGNEGQWVRKLFMKCDVILMYESVHSKMQGSVVHHLDRLFTQKKTETQKESNESATFTSVYPEQRGKRLAEGWHGVRKHGKIGKHTKNDRKLQYTSGLLTANTLVDQHMHQMFIMFSRAF